jgi:hypothetical protein
MNYIICLVISSWIPLLATLLSEVVALSKSRIRTLSFEEYKICYTNDLPSTNLLWHVELTFEKDDL